MSPCSRATQDGVVVELKPDLLYPERGLHRRSHGYEPPSFGAVDISDGFLDLYAVEHQPGKPSLTTCSPGTRSGLPGAAQITLRPIPEDVWIDGELDGTTPFTTSVLPGALEIVVPG
jgi:hypothetical protein